MTLIIPALFLTIADVVVGNVVLFCAIAGLYILISYVAWKLWQ